MILSTCKVLPDRSKIDIERGDEVRRGAKHFIAGPNILLVYPKKPCDSQSIKWVTPRPPFGGTARPRTPDSG
jgi:hypothetical protein